MENLKDKIIDNPTEFNQFKIDDMLVVEYVCFAEEEYKDIWAHNNYFVYTLSGKKGIKTLDNEYFIGAGDVIFIKKGAHTTHQFFEEQYQALIIFLPDDFIKNVIQESRIKPITESNRINKDIVYVLEADDVLSSYFYSVLSYFTRTQAPSKQLLKNKFEELVINIVSDSRYNHLAKYFGNLYASSKISIEEVMETNFAYNMKLEEFARLSGRSLSTFRRDFEQVYNTTPSKWLTNRRLEYGKHLLETTDKNIYEITSEIGFENPSHFIRIFKEKYKSSPMQFKRSGNHLFQN